MSTPSVIVLALPSVEQIDYYHDFFDDIVMFCERFVAATHPQDIALIVVDEDTYPDVADYLPSENLRIGHIPDIWIRDFAPIRTRAGNFQFRYTPQYLDRDESDWVETEFKRWFDETGLSVKSIPLILDGGNFNYNGYDRAITTERLLVDNPDYTRQEILSILKETLGLSHIALLPEVPGDVTGHSDGMVKWLDRHCVAVSSYPEPLRTQVMRALKAGLGNDITLIEFPYVPEEEMHVDGWPSAKGVYVNALTTPYAIYIPHFGLAEDVMATNLYQQYATKPVIPVKVGKEVDLGGTVRCLTWAVEGVDAQQLLKTLR
ncbi:MAG: agmatine deiminase family protein [Chloroflexota bacterium]